MAGNKLRYMLDADICINIMNGKSDRAFMELTRHNKEEVAVSSIVVAELMFGAENGSRRIEDLSRLERFLEVVQVLDFGRAAAIEYGKIRADLGRRGRPIGGNDMLIAAHANSLDLTLVTHNVREFVRVEGLEVADWT